MRLWITKLARPSLMMKKEVAAVGPASGSPRLALEGSPWAAAMAAALAALLLAATGSFLPPGGTFASSSTPDATGVDVEKAYGDLPLSFEPNIGQTDRRVDFLARGNGYTLFLTPSEAVFSLSQTPDTAGSNNGAATVGASVLRMDLFGADAGAAATVRQRLPGEVNYLTGKDPGAWRTNIPTYQKVGYQDVYPGVDVVYYGNQGSLEYDFLVAPGSSPGSISLRFSGADDVSLNSDGDLILETPSGDLVQSAPRLYQEIDGTREAVAGHFVMRGARRVGFAVSSYDRSRPLIIDPKLGYSTFVGGSGFDITFDNAVDNEGSAYVAGQTGSANYPTKGALPCPPETPAPNPPASPTTSLQCNQLDNDAFVSKLNRDGSALEYSTYLGGGKFDQAWAIGVDKAGNAYVAGSTDSWGEDPGTPAVEPKFPTTVNAYDDTCGTDGLCNAALPQPGSCSVPQGCPTDGLADTFVSKLSTDGSVLLYSTFLGGADNDQETQTTALPSQMGLAVRGNRAYVTASTASEDNPRTPNIDEGFPTTRDAHDKSCGLAKDNVCDDGNVDAYLSVINTAKAGRSSLEYSTYIGGSGYDEGKGVAVDRAGNAYVVGTTLGFPNPKNEDELRNNFPTKRAIHKRYRGGQSDAFVTKFNPGAKKRRKSLVYSSYLGGGGQDVAWGAAVKSGAKKRSAGRGKVFLTGFTDSGDDPATPERDGPKPYFRTTRGAFDRSFNGRDTRPDASTLFLNGDAFVAKLKPSGKALDYATYLGGTDQDVGVGIDLDRAGRAYVTGWTTCENRDAPPPECSGSFPVTDDAPYKNMNGTFITPVLSDSPTDIFLTRLTANGNRLSYSTYLPGRQFDRGFSVAVRNRGGNGKPIAPEAYVSGRTGSTDFPTTPGAFQTTRPGGPRDGYVTKVVE